MLFKTIIIIEIPLLFAISDPVALALIGAFTPIIALIVKDYIDRKRNKRLDAKVEAVTTHVAQVSDKVVAVDEKVEDYNKKVNGHMTELLATTKELGEKVGAEKQKEKNGVVDSPPDKK